MNKTTLISIHSEGISTAGTWQLWDINWRSVEGLMHLKWLDLTCSLVKEPWDGLTSPAGLTQPES